MEIAEMTWKVEYLESVTEWLDSLADAQLESLAKEMKLLKLCGHKLKMPHSKPVGDKVFEIRERRFGLRIYYIFGQNKNIIMIHAGNKDSQKKDIKKAKIIYKKLQS